MATVTTQKELNAALKAGDRDIIINSPRGVWLEVFDSSSVHASGSSSVRAFGSSSVHASGSSSVRAFGSSSVHAFDSSSVHAFGSSSVHAFGSSSVHASGSSSVRASGSSSVRASGSSSVRASGSSSVHAFGSSSVRASGSSSVHAFDSSSVHAFGSSSVRASGSSSVRAFDSSSVRASAYVAVHLHSANCTIEGGVVIDVTKLDLTDRATWEAYTGCTVLLEDDGRGYRLGFRGGWYEAGCRVFTPAEAVEHWSNPSHPAPESAGLLLAAVQAHIASGVAA